MEQYDFSIHRGETFRRAVYFKHGDGSVMDLTGQEGYAQIRAYPKSSPTDPVEVVCSMTVTIDGANGEVVLSIPAETTEALEANLYAYDFCLVDDGTVRYYLGGQFQVLPSVTESAE
jgi:hypothetical protein